MGKKLGLNKDDVNSVIVEREKQNNISSFAEKEVYKAGSIYGTVNQKEIYKAGSIYGIVSLEDIYKAGNFYGTISIDDF